MSKIKKPSEHPEHYVKFGPFIQWCAANGYFDSVHMDERIGLLSRFLLEEAGHDYDKHATDILEGCFGSINEQVKDSCLYMLEQGTLYAVARSNYDLEQRQLVEN